MTSGRQELMPLLVPAAPSERQVPLPLQPELGQPPRACARGHRQPGIRVAEAHASRRCASRCLLLRSLCRGGGDDACAASQRRGLHGGRGGVRGVHADRDPGIRAFSFRPRHHSPPVARPRPLVRSAGDGAAGAERAAAPSAVVAGGDAPEQASRRDDAGTRALRPSVDLQLGRPGRRGCPGRRRRGRDLHLAHCGGSHVGERRDCPVRGPRRRRPVGGSRRGPSNKPDQKAAAPGTWVQP